MSIYKELDQAKNFYKRAQREQDTREMRRQAREIHRLSCSMARAMGYKVVV